jgi:hypothetical protein
MRTNATWCPVCGDMLGPWQLRHQRCHCGWETGRAVPRAAAVGPDERERRNKEIELLNNFLQR